MTNLEDRITPYSIAISTLAQSIKVLDDKKKKKTNFTNFDKRERSKLSQSISCLIEKAGDLFPSYKSKLAHKVARRLKIGDLCRYVWEDQPSFDKGRKLFIREHMHTVSEIKRKCLKSIKPDDVKKEILKIKMVWILKAEDKILTRNKKKSKRKNPEKAYDEAGIKIMGVDRRK